MLRLFFSLFLFFPTVAIAANFSLDTTNSKYLVADSKPTYSAARNAVVADTVYPLTSISNIAANGLLGGNYYVRRADLAFDTSAATNISSAKLWLYIPNSGGADVDGYTLDVVDTSTLSFPVTVNDFPNFSNTPIASIDLTTTTNVGDWVSVSLPTSIIASGITRLGIRLSGDIQNQIPTGYNTLRVDFSHTPYIEIAGASSGSIILNEVTDGKIVQRSVGVGSLDVSGTYTGTIGGIEARVLDAGVAVTGWQSMTSGAGTFSGTISNIPEGGWYTVEARAIDNTAITDTTTNTFGVGILVGVIGQSLGDQWFTVGSTLTPNALTRKYVGSWQTNTGDGAVAFGNELATTYNVPVGLFDYAVDGTCLENLRGGDYWLNPNGMYKTFTDAVAAQGDTIEYIVWVQGECDAAYGGTYSGYKAGLSTLYSRIQTDIQGNPYFLISLLGRWTGGGQDAETQAIRDAQEDFANETAGVYIGATIQDLPAVDTVHLTNEGYKTQAQRMAHTVKYINGTESYYEGSKIIGYTVSGNTVTVQLSGTDFTPTTGITGFDVFDDAIEETIVSAVKSGTNQITITTADTVTGTPTLRYLYGNTLDVGNIVYDTTPMTLPLRGTKAAPTALYTPTEMLFYDTDGLGCTLVTTLNGSIFGEVTPCI